MELEFNIPGVSIFRSALPLSSQVESDYSYCLPQSLAGVAQTRKQHYVAGRYCAIQAAKKLGFSVSTISTADSREPIWPAGITGSISHSKSLAISCITESQNFESMGIDAEELIKKDIADKISYLIASESELEYLRSLNQDFGLTLLFSAKEALYKALFPLGRKFIDFKEAILVSVDLVSKSFQLKLQSKDPAYEKYLGLYQGKFDYVEGNIVSLVLVEKASHAHS